MLRGQTAGSQAMASSQAAGPGSSPDALVSVSGTVQKYVAKKKKVLNPEEAELYELTHAAGIVLDQEVFKILVDLLKMNVAPLAVFQMLKSMCAGHKITDTVSANSSSISLAPSHSDVRGRNKLNPTTSTTQGPGERSCREGSSQRIPRQPSASRMQKSSSSGKSSGGSST